MTNDIPEVLTPAEAAPLLRCHYKTVLELIKTGKLKASKYGSQRYRILRSSIEDCLRATEVVTKAVTEKAENVVEMPANVPPGNGAKPKSRYDDPLWFQKIGGR